jgi:Mor family transcriptional regulator
VHRGVLGFDYADLINLVDMSGTRNVDRLFQMLCRLVRRSKHFPDAKKLFLKVTNENQWDIAYAALSYAVGMSLPEIYYSTHKKYIQPFPVKKEFKEKIKRYRREGRPDHVDCPTLLTFKDLADFESNPLIWSVCYTTFREVRNLLSRDRRRWNLKDALEAARQYKTRKEFVSAHLHAYRFICENGYHKELDKIFAKVRWTKGEASALAETYPNVNVFRKHGGGAYNFLRKNSKSTLDKIFSGKVGTRKGQAELPDDELIERLINDPLYDIRSTGEIYTRISPQGHVTNVWRRADWIKRDTGAVYVRYGHKRITSARVVYRKHVGKLERDLVVYHKDLNRKNNTPNNLILSTQSRMMKEYYTKRKPIFGNKKISLAVAEQIRADHNAGLSYKKLVAKYGLSKSSISYLINGKTWNPETAQGRDVMTGELAEKVRKEFKQGTTRYKLTQKYGLSNYQVRNAINNRSWKKERA